MPMLLPGAKNLHYDIHLENGFLLNLSTGEGVVNTSEVQEKSYVQSSNVETFAKILCGYIPLKKE